MLSRAPTPFAALRDVPPSLKLVQVIFARAISATKLFKLYYCIAARTASRTLVCTVSNGPSSDAPAAFL